MFKTKKLVSLISAAVLAASLIPSALADVAPAFTKENTFSTDTATLEPFTSQDNVSMSLSLVKGTMGKEAADSSLHAIKNGGSRIRLSINENIPSTEDKAQFKWTYLTYSFNYLVEGDDNVETWLSNRYTDTISTKIGADKMKPNQWNHVDYVVKLERYSAGSVHAKREVYTYLNGTFLDKNGSGTIDCSTTDPIKVQFVGDSNKKFNLYLDDIKFAAYTDEFNGQTTADALIKTPAPTIDTTKANVKNGTVYPYGELNVSDIKDARIYSDHTFTNQLTEGNVSVGNVIVAEKDGVIAYYEVTDVPNNYEVIVDENFNNGSLGVMNHTFGEPNTWKYESGLAGKTNSDQSVNLIKERTNTPIDSLHFAFEPKPNSYLTIDLTFLPTESDTFESLRLITAYGYYLGSDIKYGNLHMNRWNKIKYVISFDNDLKYTTTSYINGNIYENAKQFPKATFNGSVRIGVTGKNNETDSNTGKCTTTYIDDIKVVEYVGGTAPAADVMPQLKTPEGTKATLTNSTGTFIVDGAVAVSSLEGTNGETVRAYQYNEQTKTIGDEITTVDASTSQVVIVEGANGAMSYYFVQPAFSIAKSLADEEGAPVLQGDELFECKYHYTVKAVNNGDSDKEIYMAMGRYDKDGKLKNVAIEKYTIAPNTSNFEETITIDLTNETDLDVKNDYIAVFAWDANMKPYSSSFKTK